MINLKQAILIETSPLANQGNLYRDLNKATRLGEWDETQRGLVWETLTWFSWGVGESSIRNPMKANPPGMEILSQISSRETILCWWIWTCGNYVTRDLESWSNNLWTHPLMEGHLCEEKKCSARENEEIVQGTSTNNLILHNHESAMKRPVSGDWRTVGNFSEWETKLCFKEYPLRGWIPLGEKHFSLGK